MQIHKSKGLGGPTCMRLISFYCSLQAISTIALSQEVWSQTALNTLDYRDSIFDVIDMDEYYFALQANEAIAPNRANGFRTRVTASRVTLSPRIPETNGWEWSWE